MESPKTWASAQEIADLRLPGIPTSKMGVLMRAKKEKWVRRIRHSKGRGHEFPLIMVLPNAPAPEITQELRSDLRGRLELLKVRTREAQALVARLEMILRKKVR